MSCEVFLCGEEMKAVARFKYLGMMMIADGPILSRFGHVGREIQGWCGTREDRVR